MEAWRPFPRRGRLLWPRGASRWVGRAAVWAPGSPVGQRPGRGARSAGARGGDARDRTAGERRAESAQPWPAPGRRLRSPGTPRGLWSTACGEPATRLPASISVPHGGGGASGSRFSPEEPLPGHQLSCPWRAPRLPASGGGVFSAARTRGPRAPRSCSLVSGVAGLRGGQPLGALFPGVPGPVRVFARQGFPALGTPSAPCGSALPPAPPPPLRMRRAIAGDARTRGALGWAGFPSCSKGTGQPACARGSVITPGRQPCPPRPALVNLEPREWRGRTPILASHRQIRRLTESLCGDLGEPA